MSSVSRQKKIGLVIGSGGIKCAAALGMLKVLKREQIAFDLAVGCSGGSLYAAAIALGWDPEWFAEQTNPMWAGLFTHKSYKNMVKAILPGILGFNEDFGMLDDTAINTTLYGVYTNKTFADTQIPLHIITTDLMSGASVVLSDGLIADAIRASIAIPLALPPKRLGGRLLIDGGASDPLPISVAMAEGCDLILAMGFEAPYSPRIGSLMNLIDETSHIIVNNLLRMSFSFYNLEHYSEIISILPTFEHPISITDTKEIPYIIGRGELATEEQLPYLHKLLAMNPSL